MPAIEEVVERAVGGDREALGSVLASLRDPLLRLATGMFWDRADAEDATQEALIAVMTNLGSFRGEAALSTWAYRIAVRLFARRRRSPLESVGFTWEAFAADLDAGWSADLAAQPDQQLLAEEVRIGCTLAVLQCLDRPERVAYLLADVLSVPGEVAADVLGVSHVAYRQRVVRTRAKVRAAVERHCGIVDPAARCRCAAQVDRAVATGRVDPARLRFTTRSVDVAAQIGTIQELHDVAALFRATGRFSLPNDARPAIDDLLALAADGGLLG